VIFLFLACQPKLDFFPEDFVFGTATAGFQVDPGCPTRTDCVDVASDWNQWVTDPELIADKGNHLSGDALSMGPGHWELFEEDLDRAAEMGSVFRFSFEWSRLFPDGAAEQASTVEELTEFVDMEALAWYQNYLQAMEDRGLTPMATVNHYTLPLWVHDGKACNADPDTCVASGWLNQERIVPLITLFTSFLAQEFGSQIDLWLTLNEPVAVFLSGYIFPSEDRTNPPGISRIDLGLQVAQNMAAAHGAMAQALHAGDENAQVGVVVNLGQVLPADPEREQDVLAAEHMHYLYNELIPGLFLSGNVDSNLDGVVDSTLPGVLGQTDFLGLNYYFGFQVIGLGRPAPGFEDYPIMDFFPDGFDFDPSLLAPAIEMTAAYGLPIWITENGVADPDEESVDNFLVPSLRVVQEYAESADIRGYMYWSLVDNYEWNHGMNMRFGLYEVDLETKERSLRPIGERYRQVVADHGLPVSLE
jgi:beta-glucosidase/6-phospho-beta-glucosidase/beta-galactosidase